MAQRPRKSLQGAPLKTLAVLLLMNGSPVSAPYISQVLGYTNSQTVRIHLATLKAHGVWQIVSERHCLPRGQRGQLAGSESTHRLAGLPPDEFLEPMLREVDELKRSQWWAELTSSRQRRTA